ncbi:MAG: anion permease [Methylobacteriaceae bacterium]|jgi:DASS family divalent anion:Na+ symporter|nr:anion permease [Methylobacteriaceae bacterium]
MQFTPNFWKGLITVAVGLIIWFIIPIPEGLADKPQAWHLFALTVAIILGFILSPLPIGAVAFIGITIVALTNTLKPGEVLAGFGDATMWLIVSAFIFSRAFLKTGLGQRIAYWFLRALGDSTLKVGYSLVLTDLVLAPLTPSSGARAGAIMFPIIRGISTALGSEPGPTSRRAGAYLVQAVYQCEGILCATFMTAMAGNALIVRLAKEAAGVDITWGGWLLASCVPAAICLVLHPLLMYIVFPPELKNSPEAKAHAVKMLDEMGPMSRQEKILAVTFLIALVLWCTSSYNKLNATVVAMAAVSVLLLFKVVEWKDMLNETGAWDTLIWMGSLVALAGQLAKTGFIPWFAQVAAASLGGITGFTALVVLIIIYMYSHYGFASMTAHISAMYAAFVAVAVAAGAPPMAAALLLGFTANLCLAITHYSGTASPMFFGPGYVDLKTWWLLGFGYSIVNLVIWITVGSLWWKFLGLY